MLRQNVGLVVLRLHKTLDARLCRGCLDRRFREMTLITLVGGWWGIISFFVTPVFLISNLTQYLGAGFSRQDAADATAARVCERCGAGLVPGGATCPGCGQRIERATAGRLRTGMATASLVLGVVGLLTLGLLGIGALAAIALGVAALVKANRAPAVYGGKPAAIAGIVCGALSLALTSLFLLVAVLGERPAAPRIPQAAAFERANEQLLAFTGQEAFGNTPEAVALAERFARILRAMREIAFTKGRREGALSLTQGRFLTYCELRQGSICFLVHVPEFKNYTADAKRALLDIAWTCARQVTAETRASGELRIGIGLRGILMYGAAATGMGSGEKPEAVELDAPIDEARFHPFFRGSSSAPPRLSAPAALADFQPKVAKGAWARAPWRQRHVWCEKEPVRPDGAFNRSRWIETCGYIPPPPEITITGGGFSVPAGRNSVFFGGVAAEVVGGDAQRLVVRPLGGAGLAQVSVRTSGSPQDDPAAPDRSVLAAPMRLIGPPQKLVVVEGNGQSLVVGSRLSRIVVKLTDAADGAVPEERVWFSLRSTKGRFTAVTTETMTDAAGLAVAEVTLPDLPDTLDISATAVNVAADAESEPRVAITANALPQPEDLKRLVEEVRSSDGTRLADAVQRLGDLGPLAKSAAPSLLPLAQGGDQRRRDQAIGVLARIDPDSALRLVLPDLQDESKRLQAVLTLEIIGPAAAPAAPSLGEILRTRRGHAHWSLRFATLGALQRLGRSAAPAMPGLLVALEDEDWQIRKRAALVVYAAGPPEWAAAKGAFQRLLNDPIRDVRDVAKGALGAMGSAAR